MTAADLPRYRVVAGGRPSPEELAALAVALTPVLVERYDGTAVAASGWLTAALHEAVSGARVTSAAEVAALR